jgi:gamma-glutamyltranspeptidase / glutathione hydrolase
MVAPVHARLPHHHAGSAFSGRRAIAVTPHHLATAAAVDIMSTGGTAADAAIAANAVLGMVLPTTCGIGGDLFALVHRPGDRRPAVLNASGRAGSGADADALRGGRGIPARSAQAITVPGCVDGWEHLADRYGSKPIDELLAPAIALGLDGFEVSAELSSDLERIEPLIADQPAATTLYPGGVPPAPGTIIRRPDLATTLATIATDGRAGFYEGHVARAVAAASRGLIEAADLQANTPDWVEPIGAEVFGVTGWTVPPNSQGYLTLAAAMVLEALGAPPDPDDPAFHHAVVEAYRSVAWERDDLVADPRFAPLDPGELLDGDRLVRRAAAIRDDAPAVWPSTTEAQGGTAYFCAVDESGMAVSGIQSNFHGIGSGISAGDTGIFLHNRGAGFSLVPGHPNELAPGKRPLHTLSPTLWTRDGACALLLGTRGGDQQPQYLIQMVALMLLAGLDPAEAQRRPRWRAAALDGARSTLTVEVGMPEHVVAGLIDRGHVVDGRSDATAGWGPVSVVAIDAAARRGAADPRVSTATAAGN